MNLAQTRPNLKIVPELESSRRALARGDNERLWTNSVYKTFKKTCFVCVISCDFLIFFRWNTKVISVFFTKCRVFPFFYWKSWKINKKVSKSAKKWFLPPGGFLRDKFKYFDCCFWKVRCFVIALQMVNVQNDGHFKWS